MPDPSDVIRICQTLDMEILESKTTTPEARRFIQEVRQTFRSLQRMIIVKNHDGLIQKSIRDLNNAKDFVGRLSLNATYKRYPANI